MNVYKVNDTLRRYDATRRRRVLTAPKQKAWSLTVHVEQRQEVSTAIPT